MVMEKGEGKPRDSSSAPTAHISSKLTERFSLRNHTQAGLGHFETESSVQKQEPKAREPAEPPCSVP